MGGTVCCPYGIDARRSALSSATAQIARVSRGAQSIAGQVRDAGLPSEVPNKFRSRPGERQR